MDFSSCIRKKLAVILSAGLLVIITACSAIQPTSGPAYPSPSTEPIQTEVNSEDKPSPSEKPITNSTPVSELQKFKETKCSFKLPEGLKEGTDITCGSLSTPSDRQDPNSPMVNLPVAIIHNPDAQKSADPIIYLEGGPGGSALEYLYLSYESRYKPLLETGRDLIIFDQRGAGYSTPTLDCTEEDQLFIELLDNEKDGQHLTYDEMDALTLQAYKNCANDLNKKAALSSYDTNSNAADVYDLARALGYEKINLWGVSYGTRLALEVMRDYPNILRSVVLDSTFPPQVDSMEAQPANLDRVFKVLFTACEADSACSEAYPNLHDLFFKTVEELNANPARFEATDFLTNKTYTVEINGDNFTDLIFQFLYDSSVIPLIPKLIADADQGRFDLLGVLVGSVIATHTGMSEGMHMAVQCGEEYPFTSPEKILAAAEKYPEWAFLFKPTDVQMSFDICREFNIQPEDISANQIVKSDVPTFVMAGEYDPVTPPTWGKETADNLANAYFAEYPGEGHGPSMSEGCPREMLLAFITDPSTAPDDSCIKEMAGPAFVVPSQTEIYLIPFKNETMAIQGVVPEGWKEVNSGVFSRGSSDYDAAVVLAQASAGDGDFLVKTISQQLQLDKQPEVIEEKVINDLTWRFYNFTVQGLVVDMAVTEKDGQGMIVLLQSSGDERDDLFQSVFTPMVEALVPLK